MINMIRSYINLSLLPDFGEGLDIVGKFLNFIQCLKMYHSLFIGVEYSSFFNSTDFQDVLRGSRQFNPVLLEFQGNFSFFFADK